MSNKKTPSFMYALGVIVTMITFIMIGMMKFDASLTIMFLFSWLIVVPATIRLGYTNEEIETGAYEVAKKAFNSNMIILAVGALIGAWIACGTIPAIVASGLVIITPQYFLLTTLLLCSLTSLATGTSWGTLGTAGLAMISIGNSMGIPPGLTAGAIISGAFFGDKMSPLSDSTVLAAAVCECDLMKHIKHMMLTTGPAYIISAVLYTVIGFKYSALSINQAEINGVISVLNEQFNLGIIEFLPIALLFGLLLFRKPAVSSILTSAVAGVLLAVVRQGASISDTMNSLISGYSVETGLAYTDKLLNRGGMMSMAETVILVFTVFVIAGMLQKAGFMEALLRPLLTKIGNSRTRLFGSTFIVSYFANAFSGSMMFTSVMVGTMMSPMFKEFKLKPENLSRVIEDTATLGGPLIPWNSNAIFASQTLGVSPMAFIPYCFLSWITPVISFMYGVTGMTLTYYDEGEEELAETMSS